jgi:predicted RNase H-like HicB family nuclease
MENKLRNNTIEIDKDKFRFDVDVYIFREEKHMAAYCPSLDLATTGNDFQDAVKNFYECLQLHVECCMEMGTFEEDLKEHGWKVSPKRVVPPSFRTQLKSPQLSELMQSNTNFERISAPVRIAAFA